MYRGVYNTILDVKVAISMYESEYSFINRSRREVNTEEETAGHQINHNLSHPQYVLFGDEVGTDTNQVDDGNNGGQCYISIKGMKTNLLFSKASGRFILMRLTYATDDPVFIYASWLPKV